MNTKKYELMVEGGKRLHEVKNQISQAIKAGVTPIEIDALADKLITQAGDFPSFKTVRDYHHATCININEGIVHGIPTAIPFVAGDVVSVDVGLVHHDYHLDSAITVAIPPISDTTQKFLQAGKQALRLAVAAATPGNTIYDISLAMQQVIEKEGYSAIRDLTGHGVGRQLHESPSIPCYADNYYKREILRPGQTLAIEVMYAARNYRLVLDEDGWTLRTRDRSLTALFEDSVFILPEGNIVLT